MSDERESYLIAKCTERREFVTAPRGEWHYWPEADRGALPAWALRAIADELDRRNNTLPAAGMPLESADETLWPFT
jgi:hypothetical protein